MSVDHGNSPYLQRSPYTSTYAHMGEVYVYHDLFGYILKMSPDILAFLDEFAEERVKPELVCRKHANAFGDMTPESFVGIFLQFGCLIIPGYDQIKDIWDYIPVKSRWNVWTRTEGKLTFYAAWGDRELARVALSEAETAIWDKIDGEAKLDDLAAEFGRGAVGELVKKLAHNSVQAMKLSALPMSFYLHKQHMKPPYLTSTMPYAPFDPKTDALPPGFEDMFSPEGYYRHEVEDADAQFDHQETTLSHLFRQPHPALRNRTYGEALIDALKRRWDLQVGSGGSVKILEIGGGLGWVAKHVTEALEKFGTEVTYHIQELSPALAAKQRENTAGLPVTVFEGDALTAELPGNDYDLVISNEMIGDLTAIKLTHEQLGMGGEEGIDDETFEAGLAKLGVAGELVKKHTVPIGDAPDPFYLNVGAWQLVERLWDVLKPGGHAILTEFGELNRYPVLSTQLDHPELSIHFGHLTSVARSVGFETDFEFVMDLIEMNREMKGLATTRSYFRALTAALADHDIAFEKIGYTKKMFLNLLGEKLRPSKSVGEIDYDNLEDRLMGLVPHEFKALLLTKPLPH
ncbi:MAG: class I SAM-dependent methyltransferase [Deltaproteobacteria bacterium]|nr:MAG: class I SAM-dependent methyltransferase [Deltaproteobacteria bacterium]